MLLLETSHDPRTGEPCTQIPVTSAAEVDAVLARASAAFSVLRDAPLPERARWLEAASSALEGTVAELVTLADRETALGTERLSTEVRRAAEQVRFYGRTAARGRHLGATISASAGLRRIGLPIGPVAVFGASNFPFAFGAVGNDTASALAAGCPVVVKAHPAHLATGRRTVEIVSRAIEDAGAPRGTLQLVVGHAAGLALVEHPAVAAVAFTGSTPGGTSLWRRAQERAVPIPVYAEMGTVNPVVVLPTAARRRQELTTAFVESYTLGDGQLCTKPGLLLAPAGRGFARAVADALLARRPQPVMLTGAIADSVRQGLADLEAAGATVLATSGDRHAGWAAPAAVLTASPDALQPGSRLLEECFGAVALVVEYDGSEELQTVLSHLPGALAGALHTEPEDALAPGIVATLQRTVGRVVMNGWTTGVGVDPAQHHGGPWPATTDSRTTSVGAAALDRFVRPVAFQGVADALLPAGLQDANPWAIERVVQ